MAIATSFISSIPTVALCFLCGLVSSGFLQKGDPHPLPNALNIRDDASNITYQSPSLTPQPPNAWDVTSLPPLDRPPERVVLTVVDEPSTFAQSSLLSEAPSIAGRPSELADLSFFSEAPSIVAILSEPAKLDTAATFPAPTDVPGPMSGCTLYEPCNIFFQFVTVYYWPQGSQNTACLTSMPTPPSAVPGPPFISSSPYVVFESIKASDGCNQVGPTFADKTVPVAPDELSTIAADGATRSFNFADLPCGPASVPWDPAKPYAPRIAPPPALLNLDPAFNGCIAGWDQGKDPPIALRAANGPSRPGYHGGPHGGRWRAIAHAHPHARALPWAPRRTP